MPSMTFILLLHCNNNPRVDVILLEIDFNSWRLQSISQKLTRVISNFTYIFLILITWIKHGIILSVRRQKCAFPRLHDCHKYVCPCAHPRYCPNIPKRLIVFLLCSLNLYSNILKKFCLEIFYLQMSLFIKITYNANISSFIKAILLGEQVRFNEMRMMSILYQPPTF